MIIGRAAAGDRLVQGPVTLALQAALTRAGQALDGDGVFGGDTDRALRRWQAANGLPATGQLDADGWRRLAGSEPPSIFDLCLSITADFEGTSFDRVVGNFDGAGITFGLIGFTLVNGELKKLLTAIEAGRPGAVAGAFGQLFPELMDILDAPKARKLAWADDISRGASKGAVDPHWEAAFKRLGASPEARRAQMLRAYTVYWQAARSLAALVVGGGAMTALDAALFFDIAVQNSVSAEERAALAALATGGTAGAERRAAVARIIADGSSARFRADVLARKLTFSQSQGTVHGSRYSLDVWGLDDRPLPQGALDAPSRIIDSIAGGKGGTGDVALAPDSEAGEAATVSLPPALPVPASAAASPHAGWDLYAEFRAFVATLGLRHFSPDELLFLGSQQAGGKCAGLNTHPPRELWPSIAPTAAVLDRLRGDLGVPIRILSAYRSPAYNQCIDGSASNSMHMRYNAIDFACQTGTPADWAARLQDYRSRAIFRGGIGVYRSFVHVDTRGVNATWTG
ncbi:D-Ala-D-Ala carboxypeptidase family metallohydrolase [Paracraurococcus ruber]|nr:D-Ala-D-Ala carboxypeptidase family metallohydrolase [Paracraurococcus ruber]